MLDALKTAFCRSDSTASVITRTESVLVITDEVLPLLQKAVFKADFNESIRVYSYSLCSACLEMICIILGQITLIRTTP